MSEQALFEQAKVCLGQDEYENAIGLLEKCLEENSKELTYYWYLGLAYLLQENEEQAQDIWLSVFLQGNLEEVEQWTNKLLKFLEIKVQENINKKKLGNAKIIYEAIFIVNADYENPELLNNLVESLSYFASGLSYENQKKDAIEVYLEILNLIPNDSRYWNTLSFNYYEIEQYLKAEEAIKKAIELDPVSAVNYYVLGLILEKQEI